MIKGQVPIACTPGQFGKLIRKRHEMPASVAETGAWDIPCPKNAKIIGLTCSFFPPYFLLLQ